MFGFLKKKRTLKSGVIDKEVSYMMAVPRDVKSIENPKDIINRLKNNDFFTIENAEFEKDLMLTISYKDKSYKVNILPEEYELGGMYKVNHHLSEENYNILMGNHCGITVAITFSDDILDSYHLQLKVLYTIMPDMVAVVDFSSEKILSPVWTRLAAECCVPPSPEYIYSIQAISDDENKYVWLHTHGLNRCGSIELEILKSDAENFRSHSYILEGLAKRIISDNDFINEEEGFWLGRINNGDELVATWIDYKEALLNYDKRIIGSINDRESSHNKNTGVVYLYLNRDDYEKRKYSHVSAVNEYISDNLLMMLTNEETNRMSTLAMDRIDYFIDEIENEDVQGIMKIALEVDDEYKNDDNTFKEHIWFEIEEIDGIKVKGILTQDPYYIQNLKAGTEMELPLKDLTDWILYTNSGQITPDTVYLLETN